MMIAWTWGFKMRVNFDNMRRRTTRDFNKLGNVLDNFLEQYDWEILSEDKEEIITSYNELRSAIASLNCLYDDAIDGDMDDLSNELDVLRIKF